MKKFLTFILCLLPWFITYLIPLDYNYLNEIKTPFFTPPPLFYPIAWTIIYILISFTTYYVVTSFKFKEIPTRYKVTLLINYLFNQSFTLLFFGLKNNFLGFISCLGTLLSTLFLYDETALINSKLSKLLYPYILLSIFAIILSLSIYLLNI
ncbi:MAG: tryptophan-rich sensory protein [Bacilli bacterium]|nr:tryptophan-rich sensory protein [Bacilli bacterium]